MLRFILHVVVNKGDNMKRIIAKVITFLFYKKERKLPEIQIPLRKA